MTTYISILRGINVSGRNMIKMDLLRSMYEHLGFMNVKTYIQSGNVIFQAHNKLPTELGQIISIQIQRNFGFEVPVIVLTVERLKAILERNPLKSGLTKDISYLYITYLASQPKEVCLGAFEKKKLQSEEIEVTEDAVYLFCPNGYGRTKLNNSFIETQLKISATTRNWKTSNELLNISLQLGQTT